MRTKVDTKQLRELQKKIQQFEQVGFDGLAERCTNQLASRMIRKCVKRTPVGETGNLKGNWRANKAVKRGGQWRTAAFNPTSYAPYVEYGHRTRGGRGWVNGRFMMTRSADEIERDAPKIIEKEVNKELARVFE